MLMTDPHGQTGAFCNCNCICHRWTMKWDHSGPRVWRLVTHIMLCHWHHQSTASYIIRLALKRRCFLCFFIDLFFLSSHPWKKRKFLDVSSPAASFLLISRPPISPQVPAEETLKLSPMKDWNAQWKLFLQKNKKKIFDGWYGWWNVKHLCKIPFYLVRHT